MKFNGYIHFRFNNRTKTKIGHAIKSNILGEKFVWFTEQIGNEPNRLCLTPNEFAGFIELYVILN